MMRIIHFLIITLTISGIFTVGVTAQPSIHNEGISLTNVDVRGAPYTAGQITITTEQPGKAIVKFNGHCYADIGDRIVLAASDMPAWLANDGNVTVEVINSDQNNGGFSHTRVYDIGAGTHDFYAVAQNYVEMDGSGIASIYGDLSVEFIPESSDQEFVEFNGIVQPNVNLRGNPVVLSQLDVYAPSSGKVIVTFDGNCIASPGDRIILAASDTPGWLANDGNVGVEVFDNDVNHLSFSHTREYSVSQGNHSFYAVGENYVELDGTGIASVYGSLTVQFVPGGAASNMMVEHNGIMSYGVDFRGAPVVLSEITINAPEEGTVEVSFDGHCYTDIGDRIILAASDGPYWQANDGNVSVEAYDADLNHFPFSHTRAYEVTAGSHTFYAVGQNYVEMDGSGIGSVYGSLTVIYTPKTYVGIENPVSQTSIVSIYPNPVKDQFTLSIPEAYEATTTVEILDVNGKIVKTIGNISGREKELRIDMSAFTGGTYFVRLKTAHSSEVLPFVKF